MEIVDVFASATTPSRILHERANKPKDRRSCCVPQCTKTGSVIENGKKIVFHMFPTDPKRRQLWIMKIKRDIGPTFRITESTVVCSRHFKETDYRYTGGYSGKCYLFKDAVPSIFDCWKDHNKTYIYTPFPTRQPNKWMAEDLNFKEGGSTNISSEIINNSNGFTEFKENSKDAIQEHMGLSPSESLSVQRTLEVIAKGDKIITRTDNQITKWDEKIVFQDEKLLHLDTKIARCQKANNDYDDDLNKSNTAIPFLENELAKEKAKTPKLHKTIKECVFCIDNILGSDVRFYTGLPSIDVFNCLLDAINPGKNGENIIYSISGSNACIKEWVLKPKQGQPRALSPRREFFMWLCRVRLGLCEQDLAYRFQVSKSTVNSIIMSWSDFLYLRFGSLNIWPTKQQISDNMPDDFRATYPNTRVIIDCIEIPTETHSSFVLQSKSYKSNNNTLKSLIGVTPAGHVSFVSSLYQGNISKREITIRSGLLDRQYHQGDGIMADKGFDIQDLFDPLGVKLNIPAFVRRRGKMTASKVRKTQQMSNFRIHVERWMNKLKNFQIWKQPTLLTKTGTINQMWGVCAYLTLFQDPISSVADA